MHSFIEGLTIGLGFGVSFRTGLLVAVAIISHDFADGANTVTLELNASASRRLSKIVLLIDAVMPLVGASIGTKVKVPDAFLWLVLSSLAGALIYLGAVELLPEAGRNQKPVITAALGALGIIFIFGLSRIIG